MRQVEVESLPRRVLEALRRIAGERRFLVVGDSKLISYANLTAMIGADVEFIAPAPKTYVDAATLGAWRSDAGGMPRSITVRTSAADPLRVVGSRSHPTPELAAYLAGLPSYEITDMGSAKGLAMMAGWTMGTD